VRVEKLELRRSTVLVKFRLPVGIGERRQGARYRSPFCYRKTVKHNSSVIGRHKKLQLAKAYPDSVNRVRPPNTTIPKTLAALARRKYPTDLELVSGNDESLLEEVAFAWRSSAKASMEAGLETVESYLRGTACTARRIGDRLGESGDREGAATLL
jgi:hypothetical protein